MSLSAPSTVEASLSYFLSRLEAQAPYLSKGLETILKQFGDHWQTEFSRDLAILFPTISKLDDAINGYIQFVLETARFQAQFGQTGEYPAKTHSAACETVFENTNYMSKVYLPGVLLINYLWPHQYALKQHFCSTFVKELARDPEAYFLDVGVGSGFFSRIALELAKSALGVGYDISTSALEFAQNQMECFNVNKRWLGKPTDILTEPINTTWNFIMSVEILHLFDDPIVFLHAIRDRLNEGGIGYISTALNAAEADAVYVYRSPSEVEQHLTASGLVIIDRWKIAAHPPRDNTPVPHLVSYLVTRS